MFYSPRVLAIFARFLRIHFPGKHKKCFPFGHFLSQCIWPIIESNRLPAKAAARNGWVLGGTAFLSNPRAGGMMGMSTIALRRSLVSSEQRACEGQIAAMDSLLPSGMLYWSSEIWSEPRGFKSSVLLEQEGTVYTFLNRNTQKFISLETESIFLSLSTFILKISVG